MAGIRFSGATAQIATGTSAKTLLQVVAPSNHRVLIDEIAISFEGVSATNAPIQVRILRQTTAGTMTALTPKKLNSADDETLQTTMQHTATAEPTAGDVLMVHFVHPQSGYTWQAPFGRQLHIPGGTRLGIEVTAVNEVDALVRVHGEE